MSALFVRSFLTLTSTLTLTTTNLNLNRTLSIRKRKAENKALAKEQYARKQAKLAALAVSTTELEAETEA